MAAWQWFNTVNSGVNSEKCTRKVELPKKSPQDSQTLYKPQSLRID